MIRSGLAGTAGVILCGLRQRPSEYAVDPTMISYRRPEAGAKAKEKIVTPEGEVVCADKVSSESAEGFGYISHLPLCKARNR